MSAINSLGSPVPSSKPAEIEVVKGHVKSNTQVQSETATAAGQSSATTSANSVAAEAKAKTQSAIDTFENTVEHAEDTLAQAENAADDNLAEAGEKLGESSTAIASEAGSETKKVGKQLADSAKKVGGAIRDQSGNLASGSVAAAKGLGAKTVSGVKAAGNLVLVQPVQAAGRGLAAARTNVWVPRPTESWSTKWPLAIFLGSAAGLAAYALTSATVVLALPAISLPAILGSLMGASAAVLLGRYVARIFAGPSIPAGLRMDQVTIELQEAEADLVQLEAVKDRAVAKLQSYRDTLQAEFMAANDARAEVENKLNTVTGKLAAAETLNVKMPELIVPRTAPEPPPAKEIVSLTTEVGEKVTRVEVSSEHTKLKHDVQIVDESPSV